MMLMSLMIWYFFSILVTALLRSFVYLAPGSAFLHGSQTEIGDIADVRINDLILYVAHQGMVQLLQPLDSTLIHELSFTPRLLL